jgi:hypothetical protein
MTARLLVVVLAATIGAPLTAGAQGAGRQGRQALPPGAAAGALDEANVTPAEIRRMFDSYALMQAQEQLKITDEQFPRFLTRFKALQDIRRRTLQERNRLLQELRRLTAPDVTLDEAAVKDKLKALQHLRGDDGAAHASAHHARAPGEPVQTISRLPPASSLPPADRLQPAAC